eukprot:m.20858 g.20858  ORF g.20858 m.20858 type:complete len:484 (-) comp8216_c0_seq4:72-1523(-)
MSFKKWTWRDQNSGTHWLRVYLSVLAITLLVWFGQLYQRHERVRTNSGTVQLDSVVLQGDAIQGVEVMGAHTDGLLSRMYHDWKHPAAHQLNFEWFNHERVPPTIRPLQGLVHPHLLQPMRYFFTQMPPGEFRIFVEDDIDEKPLDSGPCAKLFLKEFHKRVAKDNPYAIKFGAELLIPLAVRASAYSTPDPTKAHLFLVASCIIGQGQQGHHIKVTARTVQEQHHRFWNDGARHAFVLTGDHGPCLLFRERMGENEFFRNKVKRWHDESIRNATFLMNEGSLHGGCYDPTKDFTVPTTVIHTNTKPVCAPTVAKDRHLVFMSGLTSSTVRRRLVDRLQDHPDVFTPTERVLHEEFLCFMAASDFCLCPRGQAAWSPRLEEAIFMGCIPVLIADDYEPPFSHLLDYSQFSVRVAQDDAHNVVEILKTISDSQKIALKTNVQRVQGLFRYTSLLAEHDGSDMTPAILFQLWLKFGSHPYQQSYS